MVFKKKKRDAPEIPLASTADVAFLLLIFFIATTVFSMEEGLTVLLPTKGSKIVKVNVKNVARIVADEYGNVTIDKQPIAIEDIEDEVRMRIAENDKLVISLETHPRCEYGVMVSVLDQLKLANATRFSLRALKAD
ncbi:MAG: biopolymer transporter ExbD [Candidatus Eiseniibacteriota bacterium]|nr:MAG: biopolymer transporter ExbD [Candidatus Eisenbacteria bacterium]